MTRSLDDQMTPLTALFKWLGGGLFVAALALTAWAYAFWFGARQPWNGWGIILFDALLFTAFAAHHSIFARTSVKTALRRFVPEQLWRSVFVWIASLLLIGVCLLWQPVGGELFSHEQTVLRIAHGFIQLTGLWLITRSVSAINALELAGIHPPSQSGSGTLHVTGPYHLVRHPLYFGWILIVWGAAHLTGDRVLFAAITTAYLAVAIPWEERLLQDVFGEQYVRYKKQVRWRLVPFVY